ncbi:MAG: NAD(P)H-hydrate dehydratase, partial [Planctomycetes bacterium]|nr:NAD(P)H-hydrate dehydratase [Planctomycetota bacterium]
MQPKHVEQIPVLPARRRDAHKGEMGRVLVIGGSRGMIGAPALAANAALRSGAGLVTVAVPERIQLHTAALCPCATSAPLSCTAAGELSPLAVGEVMRLVRSADVLTVGPALGVGVAQRMVVQAVLEQPEKPVVLDADGLNNLTAIDDWPTLVRCPLVLTPHPGEMARLIGRPAGQIQADRERVAAETIGDWINRRGKGQSATLVLVLKGAGTIVTDGRQMYVNDTGNPGMATGGAGDVLTGVVAALLAQGLSAFDAAVLGVRVHGSAGDLAADAIGEVSLMASDITEALAQAFRKIQQPGGVCLQPPAVNRRG